MKIVTYNVNGLRSRISQFGSLLKLLDSFDADIICFQETKLRRQELTADFVMADGYESFFSCTRTSDRGRLGYSGVATFCRVKSAFSSGEAALPVAAEEGFTGLIQNSQIRKCGRPAIVEGLENFSEDELLKVDSEGRCVITDHGHFVLFNIYGPRAECDDTERIQFKHTFYKTLQKRWEFLLCQGRRVFVVGDFNIAPAAIDRCEAGPDFEKNEFRRWLRSILVEDGGPFYDVFRAKYPERREAYTCWPQNSGAEEFNYGSRIDLILSAGPCLHHDANHQQGHNFMTCHVKESDILMQYSRWKPGNTPRRKGGKNVKREGSDHAPVYMCLMDIPEVPLHSTPSLSSRYLPMIHGLQQTIASVLMKRQVTEQVESSVVSSPFPDELYSSSNPESEGVAQSEHSLGSTNKAAENATVNSGKEHVKSPSVDTKKKARKSQSSQLSLKSFFQKYENISNSNDNTASDIITKQENVPECNYQSEETLVADDTNNSQDQLELNPRASTQDQNKLESCSSEKEKSNTALQEWQRIQQLMQNSLPLCKGHKEPCVSRVVKKSGLNFGRRFYVCARAEGPSSNPEANCGYFKWAATKSKQK